MPLCPLSSHEEGYLQARRLLQGQPKNQCICDLCGRCLHGSSNTHQIIKQTVKQQICWSRYRPACLLFMVCDSNHVSLLPACCISHESLHTVQHRPSCIYCILGSVKIMHLAGSQTEPGFTRNMQAVAAEPGDRSSVQSGAVWSCAGFSASDCSRKLVCRDCCCLYVSLATAICGRPSF